MHARFIPNVSGAIHVTAGVAAVLLGLVVIVGWQTGSPVLTQVRPGLPAMQYVNALAFVIAGVALLSAGRRDDVAGIAGLLTASIGLLSLMEDLLAVDPQVDLIFGVTTYLTAGAAAPARMPPNAAVCFVLAGTGLFLRRAGGAGRMSMSTSMLGATTAALGLVAVVGYATDLATAYGWGRLTSMALHTAAGFLLVGSGLAARGWRDAPIVSATRLPSLVAVASLIASVAVWHALAAHDRQRTFQIIRTQAAYLRLAIAEPVEAQARALERMALHLSVTSPDPESWAADARQHLKDFEAAHMLEWLDVPSGRSWAVPESGAPSEGGETRERAVRDAIRAASTIIGGTVNLPDGVTGLMLAVPVSKDQPRGALIGVVRFDRLAERALAGHDQFGYELAIFDGVRQVYGRNHPGLHGNAWMTEVNLGVRDTPLRLRLWPTPARLAQLEGRIPSLMLVTGLLLSAVLTSMTFFAETSRRRERELHQAALELRASEQRYRSARDAALESDRLKSQFVANVSHELRTPMNGILGLTELLLETDLTPEQRDHAVTVRECGETLLVLLNDILDLSKVAAGKLEIQSIAFEPRRLVQQTADLFEERARRKGVDLVCLVHHDVPDTVVGDPGRVRQVLTNLLGNAVKFTDAGEITVRVSPEGPTEAGVLLRIEVRDTGIGISPEASAQIFQPFVQADGSITRRYGGTGLGLVISKQLVRLMGGEMGVESRVGHGSTFWFTVLTAPGAAQPSRRCAHAGLSGLRLLVLDDSASGGRRLRELLENWRMRVTEASTSEAALELLKAAADRGEPFDAVLAQVRQPGCSVLEFAEAAHAVGLGPRTRLILISGRGQPGDAQRARDLGASAYLTHPITPSDLFDCLATVFGTAAAPDVAPPETIPLVTRYTIAKRQDPLKEPFLVVEDNLVNQKVMVGLLRKLGHRADVANNGAEALDALQRTPYRVVLMDSQMPEMDGFATTAEIRRREAGSRRTVIVCVTAHAMKGERDRCVAAGMDDYISKPVSLERLSEVLERWLAAKVEPSPAASAESSGVASEGPEPAIEPRVLAGLRELEVDDPGLVADVVSTFLRETPHRLKRVQAAFDSADAPGLERAAHGLKGSADAVGAQRLARLCEEIESSGRMGHTADCAPSLAALAAAFAEAREILERDHPVTIPR
jgi:signal transduction histidine kinase/CheY-like chemotaxis protein